MNQQGLEIKHSNGTTDLLRSVAYFFGLLYSFLTLAHFFLLQETFKWILLTAALLTATVCVVVGLNSSRFTSARQSLIILLLTLLASSNCLLHLWVSAGPEQTTNIFMIIIASGIVFSNRTYWLSDQTVCPATQPLLQAH